MSGQERRVQGGVLLFDLRQADTADDAAIEKIVQRVIQLMIAEAKRKNLQYSDVTCAALEVAARLCAGPFFNRRMDQPERLNALADDLAANFRGRMVSRALGETPGQEDIMGPARGSA